jgi:hypothetical protein
MIQTKDESGVLYGINFTVTQMISLEEKEDLLTSQEKADMLMNSEPLLSFEPEETLLVKSDSHIKTAVVNLDVTPICLHTPDVSPKCGQQGDKSQLSTNAISPAKEHTQDMPDERQESYLPEVISEDRPFWMEDLSTRDHSFAMRPAHPECVVCSRLPTWDLHKFKDAPDLFRMPCHKHLLHKKCYTFMKDTLAKVGMTSVEECPFCKLEHALFKD